MPMQITFAGGAYDRTAALIDGSVKPQSLELHWLVLPYNEIWRRMLNEYEFDASELSLSSYIIGRNMKKPLLAIPVFPARAFRHSYVFINAQSGIRAPGDLRGKRIGIAEFQQTATVWMRGILQHEYGVDLESIEWFTWAPRSRMEMELPRRFRIQRIPAGQQADEMLSRGELDAIICAALSPSLLKGLPNVQRLFQNYEEIEADFYRKTKIFPIMHTVAMREELWREHPWIATSLFKAFQHAKELAYQNLNDVNAYKISLVWFRRHLQEQMNIMGEDPWPYGLAENRGVVATLAQYLHEQGLIGELPNVDSLFAPNTLEL